MPRLRPNDQPTAPAAPVAQAPPQKARQRLATPWVAPPPAPAKSIADFNDLRLVLRDDINDLFHLHRGFLEDQVESALARQMELLEEVRTRRARTAFAATSSASLCTFQSRRRGSRVLSPHQQAREACIDEKVRPGMKTMREDEEDKLQEARKASSRSSNVAYQPSDSSFRRRQMMKLSQRLKKLISSTSVESFFSGIIIVNALFLGVEVEYTVQAQSTRLPLGFLVIGEFFTVMFVVELLLRAWSAGRQYFAGPDSGWNVFDFCLVAVSVVDSFFGYLDRSSIANVDDPTENLTFIRVVRVCRTIRIFRLLRLMRFFRSLRILIFSVLNTLRSLFWTMCLLALILYLFGMVFTQGALLASVEGGECDGEARAELERYVGSLPTSILTLFKTITGGVTWEEVLARLTCLNWLYRALFVCYVAFMSFAVLNVVTGVFCEAAIAEAEQEKDEAVAKSVETKKRLVARLQEMFRELDEDRSGTITIDEFETSLEDDRLKAYFESMDLHISAAWNLFKLLDVDGSHKIDLDEFVSGCLHLIGNAKSIDVAMLSYECRWMIERFAAFSEAIDTRFDRLSCEVKHLSGGESTSSSWRRAVAHRP